MPHYLTFGIRVPAALADFFSSIAFVRVAREPELDELSRTITNLSTVVKDVQVLCRDRVSPDRQALTPAEQTAKSERPKRKLSELGPSTDVSAKRRQSDCSMFANSPFGIGSMSEESTEQSSDNEISPIEQQVDRPSFAKMDLEIKNLFEKAAGRDTGKKDSPIEQQIDSPLFSKLPSEIRNIIYSHVLVSAKPIQPAYELHESLRARWRKRRRAGLPQPSDVKLPDDIDSAILQTCRRVHEEAISILYGENTFVFFDSRDMYYLQKSGVEWLGDSKLAQLKDGRLGLIRKASLEMQKRTTFEYLYGDWSTFIDPEDDGIHFPDLEVLKVDCSTMDFPDEEVPMINMFIAKIATFGKLKRLAVVGITHKPTLQRMKEELVREDGVFESASIGIENPNAEED